MKGWTRCGNSRFYSLESGEPGVKDILDPTSMTVIRLSSAFDRTIVGAIILLHLYRPVPGPDVDMLEEWIRFLSQNARTERGRAAIFDALNNMDVDLAERDKLLDQILMMIDFAPQKLLETTRTYVPEGDKRALTEALELLGVPACA